MKTRNLRLAGFAAVAASAAALPLAAQAASTATTLKGSVGPDGNFKITLTNATGGKVTSLKAGAYMIKISDTTAIHNFHLTGPGVNKNSGISTKGSSIWNVTLKKGTYKYVCDPHASIMKGSFTVS